MLKKKFRKLSVAFGVLIFLLIFAGCKKTGVGISSTTEEKHTDPVQTTNAVVPETLPEESKIEMKNIFRLVSDGSYTGEKELRADPYLQRGYLSWAYSLDIKIENGKISLCGITYDKISYVKGLSLSYDTSLLWGAREEEKKETLEKIKNQEGFYMLETSGNSSFGKRIAVYYIDGSYYFSSLYENNDVMRIHSAIIE